MFVKIKLEDPGNSKNPLIFSIDNNATIFDLKTNLESFVDIPADQQEIQRMDRILDNFDELSKVVNKEIDGDKINGAAISLYTNNKFFCFLQFYNKNESDNQTSFFSQPSDAKKLPIDQLPQYIEQLDSDTSWHSSSSETDSTDQSANSSDSSDDSRSPKRKSILKPNSPTKRLRDSTQDDKGCKPPSSTATPIRQTSPIQEISDPKISVPAQSGAILASQIPKTVVVVEVAPQATVPFTNKVVEASTLESIQNPKEKLEAPYIALKPEYRRYAVVINKNIDEQQPDYSHLMEHFYGLFESSRSCGRLNFSESLSVTAYDDQLWVLCEDNETCEWITKGTRILSSYKSSSFIKYFGLLKCRVVLPQVVEGKELANIFQLLELQNSGLSTTKWCVVERTMLDPESVEYASQAMTTLCKNEVLTLYLDRESECFILEKSCKLKYCFWKLTFQF